MKKCKLCRAEAKYIELSPDGKPDYFCSVRHFKINKNYFWAKGISWRALPLKKLI